MADTSEMGRTTGASPLAGTQAEIGESDNRLSLDPNDPAFDFTKEWEDGRNYTVKLSIAQVSPGEYEVLSGEDMTGPAENVPEGRRGAMGVAGPTEEPDTSPTGGTGYRNPAIAKLMAE
jgi:hypothetical protein